jgi:hypothetical protein
MVYTHTCLTAFRESVEDAKEIIDQYPKQQQNADPQLLAELTKFISYATVAESAISSGDPQKWEAALSAMDTLWLDGDSVARKVSESGLGPKMQESMKTAAQEVESRGTIAWLERALNEEGTENPSFNRQTTGASSLSFGDVLMCERLGGLLGMNVSLIGRAKCC